MGKLLNSNGQKFERDSIDAKRAAPAAWAGNGESLYENNRLIRKCVDIQAEDAVRAGWVVEVRDSENELLKDQSDYINQRMGDLETSSNIFQIFRMSLIGSYGGAGVMLATGVVNYLQPKTTITKVTKINSVKDSNQINLGFFNTWDITKESYYTVETTIGGQHIHDDFLLTCYHNLSYTRQLNITYVEDILAEVSAVLSSAEGFERVFKRLGAVLYKSPVNDLKTSTEKEIKDLLLHIKYNLDSNGVFGLHPDDGMELLNFNFGTTGQSIDVLLGLLSFVSDIPMSFFKGQPRGGIITGAGVNAETEGWYNRVVAKQNIKIKPMVLKEAKFISTEEGYPGTEEEENFTVKFNPLWNVDKKTDAEIRKSHAESDKMDLETGKADHAELRENDPRYNDSQSE